VIYLDDDIDGFDLESALPLLSEQRRKQVLRFKYELGRKTCAMAYILLRRALHEEYGIDEAPMFEYGEHGKPYIVGHPDIHFNVSHCRQAVVCAVSDQPVGIDVESIREYKDSLVHYTMNEEEVSQIEHAERPDVEFIRLWTMKEAVLKLSGDGISNDLKTVLTGNEVIETTVVADKGYVWSVARRGN
jgi:4'-phosphopantetheinyl transferase